MHLNVSVYLFVLTLFIASCSCQTACLCDLKVGLCETNCCCDEDCTSTDTAVFNTCLDTQYTVEEQRCVAVVIQRINGLPGGNLTYSGGQSCVLTNNINTHNYYSPYPCEGACENYLPQATDNNTTIPDNTTDLVLFYESGDKVLTLSGDDIPTFLTLPSSYLSSYCREGNPVLYLYNSTNTCVSSIQNLPDCASNTLLQASYYLNRNKILSQLPSNLTLNTFLDVISNCTDEITGASKDCSLLPAYDSSSLSCENAVKSVALTITTDGLFGMINVTAAVLLSSITEDELPFSQKFSVNFQIISAQSTGSNFVTAPGYSVGQTIATSDGNVLSTLGSSTENACISANRNSILFGVDTVVSCVEKVNFDYDCVDLQNNLLSYFNVSWNLLVPQDTSPSSPLISSLIDEEPVATGSTLRLGCSNLTVGANYKILYARNGSVGNPQLFISALSFSYITKRLVTASCFGSDCRNSTSKIEVSVSVSFVDISEKPSKSVKNNLDSFYWPLHHIVEPGYQIASVLPGYNSSNLAVGNNLLVLLLGFIAVVFLNETT